MFLLLRLRRMVKLILLRCLDGDALLEQLEQTVLTVLRNWIMNFGLLRLMLLINITLGYYYNEYYLI